MEPDTAPILYRSTLHRFACYVTQSSTFNLMTMTIIMLNAVTIAIETSRTIKQNNPALFSGLDLAFVTYYTVEVGLKLFASPYEFWLSGYNLFDVFILCTSYVEMLQLMLGLSLEALGNVTFLRVLRTLRALRALRGISFIRSLQVLVNALGSTLKEVLNLLGLLVLWIYIFSIMGFYFFGYEDDPAAGTSIDPHWSSLGAGFMSLFVYVTADGWTDIQTELEEHGHAGMSKLFSVCFLFVGHFIFMNLFIGVIIQNIEQAAMEDKNSQEQSKKTHFMEKKQQTLAAQQHLSAYAMRQPVHGGAEAMNDANAIEAMTGASSKFDEKNMVTLTQGSISNLPWLNSYETLLNRRKQLVDDRLSAHMEMITLLTDLVDEAEPCLTREALMEMASVVVK